MLSILRSTFAAALLLASGLAAQGPYNQPIGNQYLGGNLYADAGASTLNTALRRYVHAWLALNADVHVLKQTRSAFRVDLSGRNKCEDKAFLALLDPGFLPCVPHPVSPPRQ